MVVTNYSDARAHLASLLDKATSDPEPIRITRRGKPDVVLMAADEWERWQETIYLLRSPTNAITLTSAELWRAMAPNNVLLPTPLPPKIPIL